MAVPQPVGGPAVGGTRGNGAVWEARVQDRLLERAFEGARVRASGRSRRLVDAARRLASSGDGSLTVAEVAAEAGVALRTFYRHFAGRDELLLALFEEEARTGADLLAAELAGIEAPLDRVQTFVEGLAGLVVTGSGYASLLVQEHLRLAGSHPGPMRSALAPLVELLASVLADAADAGDIRPVDGLDVATVLALVLTQVQTVVLLVPGEAPEQAAARLWSFCRAALAPEAAAPPPARPARRSR